MSGRIVLFGATGYTGRLVASDLVAIGEEPVLAGRHEDRLRQMAQSLGGLETRIADVTRPQTVNDLVEEGDVLISTVGPFTLYGKVALGAALDKGAHYLDSTGEPEFIRGVFADAGPIAERKGTTLLTAFGLDWVPGNVAAAIVADKAGDVGRRVDVGYLVMASEDQNKSRGPVISTGTRASLLAASAAPQHSWRGGRLVLEPTAARLQSFTVDHKTRWGVSVGGSESIALPKLHPGLDEVNVYMEWPGPPQLVRGVVFAFSTFIGTLAKTKPGRNAVNSAVSAAAKKTGSGPTADARAHSGTQVVAVCRDENGRPISGVRLEGPVNGYTLTGKTIAWGAASLRAGRQRATGAVGPVEAFGLDVCLSELSSIGLEAHDLL
ncbi:MAG: saccharopine dehydrogenase NADP-binding domain-containing protein [Acidimicrobiales bacterium]